MIDTDSVTPQTAAAIAAAAPYIIASLRDDENRRIRNLAATHLKAGTMPTPEDFAEIGRRSTFLAAIFEDIGQLGSVMNHTAAVKATPGKLKNQISND